MRNQTFKTEYEKQREKLYNTILNIWRAIFLICFIAVVIEQSDQILPNMVDFVDTFKECKKLIINN